MSRKIKTMVAVTCTALCALSLTACNTGKSTLLGAPAPTKTITYNELNDKDFVAFKDKTEEFASSFSAYAYEQFGNSTENIAVSPISVFMALSLATECADGNTRDEILSALGVSYENLKTYFSTLYNSVYGEYKTETYDYVDGEDKEEEVITSRVLPTNSVWVNEGTQVNKSCIDALSNYYYCYSYSADFKNDNLNANKAIREFVKKQTNGLIDNDFNLSKETLFTLINTLYLKTIWNGNGSGLIPTINEYEFANSDGTVSKQTLLQGKNIYGRAYRTETFSTFYTSSYDGFKIKFIVPAEGYSIEDVFTAENIAIVNSLNDYGGFDGENNTQYFTRCLFPEYKCSFNEDISDILQEKYKIERFFKDPDKYPENESCDFSNLSEEKCFCSQVRHVTNLTVDRIGIEGAAVTIIAMDGTSAPSYVRVFEDFIIDKAFGFIITNPNNTTLFSGVVNKI